MKDLRDEMDLLTQPAGSHFDRVQVFVHRGHVATFWTEEREGISHNICQCPTGLRVHRHGLDANAMVHQWHEHLKANP